MSTRGTIGDPASCLFGGTRRAVLALFFGHVGEWFYFRQIVRLSGAGLGAVQREVNNLAVAGVLVRRRDGHQVYYRANENYPLFEELKNLIVKSSGLRDMVSSALTPLADRISLAFIFGSHARGAAGPDSDIDVLVVGDVSSKDVVKALGPAQARLAREINPAVYPEKEFRTKLRTGRHFIKQVAEGPKIFLIGDDDELARMAAKRLAR